MSGGGTSFKKFLNLLAFVGVVAVAIALVLRAIFSANVGVANVLSLIAQCIAYLVTAIYAFYYVYSQRNPVITIIYVVCVLTILVLLILKPF